MAEDVDESDLILQAREAFQRCDEGEQDNREKGLESIRFARLGEQWPDNIRAQRESEGRPVLTTNKFPSFIRQVVNDGRQNKPSIKVSPVDSGADIHTAKVYSGLIRSIEQKSSADIAYDTALENAVQYWVGYIRVDVRDVHENSFDQNLVIDRVLNPASIYGDPDATSADGSDWNVCFVVDNITKKEYKRRFKGKDVVPWDGPEWDGCPPQWRSEDTVQIAEWWTREEVDHRIFMLAVPTGDGGIEESIISQSDLEKEENAEIAALIESGVIEIVREKVNKRYQVTQRIMSGIEVIETNKWPGKYIPVIPVYGDEFNINGKRYIRSLVHDAMDAARMFNFWRTTSTELVALAPRVPYIGEEGFTAANEEGWRTANTISHPYLEVAKGKAMPARQPLDTGAAAGALQEALSASDDMKAILGIYDASLGARSNETSGRAIMARQREGDVSTFHFADNLSRSIRHVGRVLLDLAPRVYSERQVLEILGEDGKEETVPLNQPRTIELPGKDPETVTHNLAIGLYDVAVSTGPSYTTKREENAYNMVEFARAVPQAGAIMIDKIAKSQDWDGADEIAERAKALMPGAGQGMPLPPEIQQQLQQGMQAMEQLQAVSSDRSLEMAKLEIEQFKAKTDRMKVEAEIEKMGFDAGFKAASARDQQSPTRQE